MVTNENKTSPILILAAWFVVSIPAAWGVYYTLLNALKPSSRAPPPRPGALAPSPRLALMDDHARSDW